MTLALLLAPAAHAFCGTYVGGAGAELYNSVSQVAIVRQGTQTTLTLSNDIEGDFDDFALVVPVPVILQENDVHVLEPGIFERLDAYSEPRLVSYVCEDFLVDDSDQLFESDDSTSDTGAPGGGVDVEAEYTVGEYHIVILSATESGALVQYLQTNGYEVPDESAELLGEYIEGGAYFFAAKVSAEEGVASGDVLSPLQFTYDSAVFSLPIRLGTLNSRGEQDLILYAINSYADGQVGVSNYPQTAPEDECMYDAATMGDEFGQFYADRFGDAYVGEGSGASWATEFAWGEGGCDPCTGLPPDDQDMVNLGYDPYASDYRTIGNYFFTRLHMRYTATSATQDLVLYQSGITDTDQMRYIEYLPELEKMFPVCMSGWASNPGQCQDVDEDGEGGSGEGGCGGEDGGCATAGGGLGAMWLLGLAAMLRRRR